MPSWKLFRYLRSTLSTRYGPIIFRISFEKPLAAKRLAAGALGVADQRIHNRPAHRLAQSGPSYRGPTL